MWDRHLGRFKAAQHQIELASAGEFSISLAPYSAWPRAWKFDKHEIDKVLVMDVIEQA